MIQLLVFLIDVFWWAVLNAIIVVCMYKLFSKFRYYVYDEPEQKIEVFGWLKNSGKSSTPTYKSTSKPNPNPTRDFKRKYK